MPIPSSLYEFYILLALSRGELYAYGIAAAITNDSLGYIIARPGTIYPLLKKMTTQGLLIETGLKPAGVSGKPRLHYEITPEGRVRTKEYLILLRQSLKIGEAAGYFDDETPPEIQRIINQLKA